MTLPRWVVHPISVGGALIATLFGGLAGPVYVTYFDSLGLAKGVFRVTVSTTLLTLSIVRSTGYFATGVFRAEDFMLVAAALVPAGWARWWENGCTIASSRRRFAGMSARCS